MSTFQVGDVVKLTGSTWGTEPYDLLNRDVVVTGHDEDHDPVFSDPNDGLELVIYLAPGEDFSATLVQAATTLHDTLTSDDVVEVFKHGWNAANDEGDRGNRVRRGLAAVASHLEGGTPAE